MRKFYAFLVLLTITIGQAAFAQSGAGELRGKVVDSKTKEGVPFAGVIVELNGTQVAAQQTDFDGNYVIKPISPGKYDVRVEIIGYSKRIINGVIVNSNKQTYVNPDIAASVTNIQTVTVTDYAKPLIERDNNIAGGTLTAEEIIKLPTRNINSLVSTTAGVYQADEGDGLVVKGSRDDANDYYIDGVKVRGIAGVPQGAIEQISVITGGVPAQYGDATGGIITITTKGPSRKLNGGVEAVTSEFLDGYGYNLVSGNVSGPLLVHNKGQEGERPTLGFFLSGELESRRDQNPSYVGAWKANDSWLDYVRKNPATFNYTPGSSNPIVAVPNGNYTQNGQLDKVNAQDGNEIRNINFNASLDFQPSLNNTFKFGFSGTSRYQKLYNRSNMLFNSDNNQEFTRNTYRVFGRYTQKFTTNGEDESKNLLKNAYYTIQADFSRDKSVQQDPYHKGNLFNYGYIGKFETLRENRYGAIVPTDTILTSNGDTVRFQSVGTGTNAGTRDTSFLFNAGSANPYLANYVSSLYSFINNEIGDGTINSLTTFQGLGGIVNGNNAPSIYGGLFAQPGAVANVYEENLRDQYRISAMASADIKNHSIQVGLEYEQRIESRFRINPRALWTTMRQQSNGYLALDKSSMSIDSATGYSIINLNAAGVSVSGDTVTWSRANDFTGASNFAITARQKLGLKAGDYLDVDAYDPSTFSLDWIGAETLLDNLNPAGVSYTYSGYSFDGKRSTENSSISDFFTDETNRPVGAFRPVYIAGYIQDKFTYKDIIFSLGVRIDRFDANQQVLKDRYSLYDTRKAGEIANRPANISEDAVVYVNDKQFGGVRGYRMGDVFYDASGNVIQDVTAIKSTQDGKITPWLTEDSFDANGNPKITKTTTGFKDYAPQTQIMPRIAFSFPISDEANFFANYDILTQRPRTAVFSNPINYYLYSLSKQSVTLVSPDIAPEKTINYQLGFKQKIGNTSALTLTAFYKELKDNFQQLQIATAYPASYITFKNQDFGTIKGFTLQYDLRRTNNLSANIAYTLQFANGTGSNASSAGNLISSGESEPIRIPLPLDYDQRHTIVATLDYRYGMGTDYNGPASLKGLLEGFGSNFIIRAGSGTPYSRISQDIVQNILSADDTRFRRLIGEINGSRLPWQINMDLRMDKDLRLTSKSADGKGRNSSLNLYVLVQNVLNAKRIASLYPATGLPDDDGYLTSPQAVQPLTEFQDPQAYIDMYHIAVNNPNNFKLPRVIRIGAIYNF